MATAPCNCGCLSDPDFIIKFHKRCFKYSRVRTSKENSEDFASWAVITFLENGRHYIPYAFVDYLREIIGRSGTKHFEEKLSLYYPDPYTED